MDVLAAVAFVIFSSQNVLKVYNPTQLIFGHDMILLKKNNVDWELIHYQNNTQVNYDNNYKIIKY